MLITFLPKCMTAGNLTLRRLRMSDGPILLKFMTRDDIVNSGASGRPGRSSWIFFYWWLRKTFFMAYRIEHKGEVIGFIGLFDLTPGWKAEISLVLFDPLCRRKGYGTRAFQVLSKNAVMTSLADTIIAKVRNGNVPALAFWRKLGFQTIQMEADVTIMEKTISVAHYSADVIDKPWHKDRNMTLPAAYPDRLS